MTESKQYKIVFKGEIQEGFQLDDVKKNLAKTFKMKPQTVEKIFSGRPIIIKKNVDADKANKYESAFAKVGAICILMEMPTANAEENVQQETQPIENSSSNQLQEKSSTDDDLWRGMVGVRPPQEMPSDIEKTENTTQESLPGIEAHAESSEAESSEDEKSQLERAKEILRQSLVPANEDVSISVTPFTAVELFVQNLIVVLLSYVIVGLFLGPRKIFGFLAEHVSINGKKMKFDSIWMFIISGVAVFASYFLLIQIVMLISYVFQFGSIITVFFILFILVAPFFLGFGMMSMIQSLTRHTTVDNIHVCKPLFEPDLNGFWHFIKRNYIKVYTWGLASLCGVFLFVPVTWAVLLKEWLSRLEINGYRYEITIPWNRVILYSVANLFCFGMLIFRFVKIFYDEVIPDGKWVKV